MPRSPGRGRRRRVTQDELARLTDESSDVYVNATQSVLSLGGQEKFVAMPGESVQLSHDQTQHPAVVKWLQRGSLKKGRRNSAIFRMVRDDKPRILAFIHTLFRGGAEILTLELHSALKKLGAVQGLVMLYAGDRDFHTMLTPQAEAIFDLYEEHREANSIIRQKIIKAAVLNFKPDIVFYSLIHDVPIALRSIPGRPPVVQMMLSELDDTKAGYVTNSVEAVTTSSRAMARSRVKDMHIPEEMVFPIWNAIDPKRLANPHSLRKPLSIPLRSAVVGMVGNLNSLKRPLAGLESFSRVRHSDSHMIFAGNPADLGQQVEERSRDLGISEFVHILGLIDNVHDVYRTLDVMLNCSISEGLPMSIIEAMFMSVPVIATSIGGTPEVVAHGETGYLYDVDRLDDLDRHLKRLLGDAGLRKEMGRKARDRARTQFHIDKMAEAYMDLIHRYTISADQIACSVIMPVHNGGKALDGAIRSVRQQSYPFFEFVIVDDGSDDKSPDIIMEHMEQDDRIRMFRQPHMGIVAALNKGIEESRTDVIVRTDADDLMFPDRLKIQMDFMSGNPDIDVCGGQMLGVLKDGTPTGLIAVPLTHEEIQQAMYKRNPMSHPTVIYRKRAWEEAGGYRGDGRAEDYQLWVDMMVNGSKFANMDVPLVRYTHTHADDQSYGDWVNSVVSRIQDDYTQRMRLRGEA